MTSVVVRGNLLKTIGYIAVIFAIHTHVME